MKMKHTIHIQPNLPQGRVTCVIIGENNPLAENSLKNLGIDVLTAKWCTNVLTGTENHADLQICHLDSNQIILAKGQEKLQAMLKNMGFQTELETDDITKPYPKDVRLNCIVLNKRLICNTKTVSKQILDYAHKKGLTVIHTSQGYTKCAIAPVSDDALLTEDISIGSRAAEYGMDVLLIQKGHVRLRNFRYGFIGGCCGFIDKDKLAFNGDITKHPDYNQIKSFLYKYGVEPVCLHEGALEDIGSILPIEETYE